MESTSSNWQSQDTTVNGPDVASQSSDDWTTEAYKDIWSTDISTKTGNEEEMLNIFSGNEEEMQKVFFSFCILSIPTVVLALSSNGLAFLVFYKKPAFRKILSNKLVMNLMTINTLSCLFLFPAMILDMRMSTTPSGNGYDVTESNVTSVHNMTSTSGLTSTSPIGVCIVSSVLSSLVAHGSVLAMLSVGVDQYLAILDPLEYPFKATRVVSWQMISLVWTLSLTSSLGTAFQMVTAARHSPWSSCRRADASLLQWSQNELSPWHRNRTWLSLASFSLYSFPVFALAFMYFRIFWAARKNSRDIRRNSFHLALPLELYQDDYRENSRSKSNNLINPQDEESKDQSDRSDSPPVSVKENQSAPNLSAPQLNDENHQTSTHGNDDDQETHSNGHCNGAAVFPRRAPKLSALRASSNGAFSRPLVMTSVDVGTYDDDVLVSGSPILRAGGSTAALQRRTGSRVLVTPKRKCSFSSFSECRLVADGGKTRTFLFSMETPSMSPPISPSVKDDSTPPPRAASFAYSAGERRRQFSLGCTSELASMTSMSEPVQMPPKIKDPSPASNSEAGTPEGSNGGHGGQMINRKVSLEASELTAPPANISPSSPKLATKSGSLISMTSQAARRLSCTVSRRASSVYHFFQYREELRTAKITALVLVIAFVCWSPFFLLLLLIALQNPPMTSPDVNNTSDVITTTTVSEDGNIDNATTVFWLHYTSCLMGLSFAAASPYVYVFRSEKVQKCLRQLLFDLLCCCIAENAPELTSKLASRAGSISCVQATAGQTNGNNLSSVFLPNKNPSPSLSHCPPTKKSESFQTDRRSLSCPSLDVDPFDDPENVAESRSQNEEGGLLPTTTNSSSRARIIVSQPSFEVSVEKKYSGNNFANRSRKFYSPDLLLVPSRKKCDCRTFHRIPVPCTRSNLEIDDDIMEEEEEMYMNERNLEHRRLSTSLPFGLNLIERPPLETTV